ncbi:MAG TPA: hypothetical protein VJR29_14160 [bacterium]|nr:hypothetical protein [bacterium]
MRTAIPAVLLLLAACLSNRGIETGNPDLKGKTLTLVLRESAGFYVSKFLEETALLSQVNPESFETVSESFLQVGGRLSLETTFSDGNQVVIESRFDDQGELLELRLLLNGAEQPVEVSIEDGQVPVAEPERVFLQLAESLCQRIVVCNASFEQASCEAELLSVPGLSGDFGDPVPQSLAEAQARVDNGDLSANEPALEECAAAIGIVPCSTVQRDFNDEQDPDYSKAAKIVPKPVCARGILR